MIKTTAKTFANTKGMSREEWLATRRKGIGGSDASAIMGLNPYSSPLAVYLDKIGKAEEKETTEAMRQGTDLENYVAERFCEDTGKRVKRVNRVLQHPEYPWMLANIDRDIIGEDAGLECKTTSQNTKFKLDDGEIPPHYYWQSMHYMAVTGAKTWYVAILVYTKGFYVFRVDRDEDAIRQLIEAEKDFWENHVAVKVPPLPTGADADDDAIDAIYPTGEISDVAMDLSDLNDTLDLRAFKVKERDAIQEEIDKIDQTIKLAMGTFDRAFSGDWRIKWTNTSSNRVDTKLLKEKYPQIAAECTKTTTSRRFTVGEAKSKEE